jgi:hypothetical protein
MFDLRRLFTDRMDQFERVIKLLQHPRPDVYGVVSGIDP